MCGGMSAKNVCLVSRRLRAVQIFLCFILILISKCFDNTHLVIFGKHLPWTLSNKEQMSWLNLLNARVFSPYRCVIYGVHFKPSTTAHPWARMTCFATKKFEERKVVEVYYGTVIYKTILDALIAREVYRMDVIAATRKQFEASETWP